MIRRVGHAALALLAGLAAAWVAWLSAHRPAWASNGFPLSESDSYAFTDAGQTLLTVHDASEPDGILRRRVVRRVARTGQLLSEAIVDWPGPTPDVAPPRTVHAYPVGERRITLGADIATRPSQFPHFADMANAGCFYLFDAATGRQVAGPFFTLEGNAYASYSDRDWFSHINQLENRVDVISAVDGAVLVRFAPSPRFPIGLVMSPDRRRAAVQWNGGADARDWPIQVVECPSGRVVRTIPLPAGAKRGMGPVRWEHGRLFLSDYRDPVYYEVSVGAGDGDGDAYRPEPARTRDPQGGLMTDSGRDWLAAEERDIPTGWMVPVNRAARAVGFKPVGRPSVVCRLSVLDAASGSARGVVTAAPPEAAPGKFASASGFRVSPDGWLVAAYDAGAGRVLVWNLDRVPPRTQAAAFGIAGFAAALLLSRRISRLRATTAS